MKLIPMTDFVLEKNEFDLFKKNAQQIRKYAKFLKQPLKLGMFIPCDINGYILEDITGQEMIPYYVDKVHRFLTAQQRVLFKDFKVIKKFCNTSVWYYICDFNEKLYIASRPKHINEFTIIMDFNVVEDLVQFNLEMSDAVSF